MSIENIDFTNAEIDRLRMYGGANGNKIGIVHRGEKYMLKFPPKPTLNPEMSYTNSCISEYVACNIFHTLGINVQQTLLGQYDKKTVVACKDFEVDGFVLKDFAQLKNTIVDGSSNGYGTELSEVLEVMEKQQLVSPAELERAFWDMFAADALLGNFDRHNGNWGFLVNNISGAVKIAPVYDCGSCLYPQVSENMMMNIVGSREETEKRIFVYPTSALKQGNKKINYCQFLLTTENAECIKALERIGGNADLSKINAVIENTPYISDVYKQFLRTMIKARKEYIIDRALERISKRSVSTQKNSKISEKPGVASSRPLEGIINGSARTRETSGESPGIKERLAVATKEAERRSGETERPAGKKKDRGGAER
jgi:hypothetical protein